MDSSNKTELKGVKLMWAKLAKPNTMNEGQTPKYEVELQNLSKDHITQLKELDPSFTPNDGKKRVDRKGESLKHKGFYCTPRSTRPVPVYDSKPSEMTLEDIEKIGNESFGNVTLHSYKYDTSGNKGVALGLDSVQVTKLLEYTSNPYEAVPGGYGHDGEDKKPAVEDNVPY